MTQIDLYGILKAERTATPLEIKKAFYKQALIHHPDKSDNKSEEQKELFQQIQLAYSVLYDQDKRKVYDRTGSTEGLTGDIEIPGASLSLADLILFEKEYKGSEEEKQDLIRIYKEARGDMVRIIDEMFFGDDEQDDRYREILQNAIDVEGLESFRLFQKKIDSKVKAKRKRAAEKEAKEAKERSIELGLKKDGDLAALIHSRQKNRMQDVLDSLEEKYSKKSKKSQ